MSTYIGYKGLSYVLYQSLARSAHVLLRQLLITLKFSLDLLRLPWGRSL